MIGSSPSESIYKLLQAHWQAQKAGCECGGTCEVLNITRRTGDMRYPQNKPCPSCAAIDELIKKWCWHESFLNFDNYYECENCGKEAIGNGPWGTVNTFSNPNLTAHLTGTEWTVLAMLRDAGLLERYTEWHNYQLDEVGFWYFEFPDRVINEASAEILTNGEYLCQSIEAFLKEVVG